MNGTKEIIIYALDGDVNLHTGWRLIGDTANWWSELKQHEVDSSSADFALDLIENSDQVDTCFVTKEMFKKLTNSEENIQDFQNIDAGIIARARASIGEHVLVNDSGLGKSYLHMEGGMFIVTDEVSCTPKLLTNDNTTLGYNTSITFG